MLNLHEQVRGLLTDEGDRVEGVQNLAGTAFAQNPAEGVDRDAAGGFAAALLNAGIGADLFNVVDSTVISLRYSSGFPAQSRRTKSCPETEWRSRRIRASDSSFRTRTGEKFLSRCCCT